MSEENKSDLIEYAQNNNLQPISGDYGYNDTDAVVFSTLEYLNFEEVDIAKGDTLKDAINKYLAYEETKGKDIDSNKKALAEAIKNNPRYKDLKIENVQAKFNENEPEQFAAMTVVLPEGQKVAVFRGTDGSNSGWWEDLSFGYNTDPEGTAAQRMAREYVENITGTDTIYITGHSKGGGLAEWSALMCGYRFDKDGNVIEVDDEVRKKIKSVISLDGPGQRSDILKKLMKTPEYKELMDQVGDNWYTIVPPESVVGYIMTDPKRYKIVQSNAYSSFDNPLRTLFQHDTFTWLFKDGHIDCSDINSKKTGLFSQFCNGVLDDSMKLIPRGILERVSDTGFAITGKVLDDEIAQYFEDVHEAFDSSFFKGIEKLEEGQENVFTTVPSFLYTLAVIKEEIKFNLEKTAIKYGIEKIKEGVQYAEKQFEVFKEWCESKIDKLEENAENLWDSMGIKLSKIFGGDSEESSNYIAANCCIAGGVDIIEKSLYFATYVAGHNSNPVELIGDTYIKALKKLIDNICIDNRPWEYVLRMHGLDKTQEGIKFIKTVRELGIKMSQYISEILCGEGAESASQMSPRNVSICNGKGQIGLEFNLVPEIDKVIENVIDNLNVSVSGYLDDIESRLNSLEYTSFSLDIDYCRHSLNRQRSSLCEFKKELHDYDKQIKNMEEDIIRKLDSIKCDYTG